MGRLSRQAPGPTPSPRSSRRASARSPSWSRRRSPTSTPGSSSSSRAPGSSRPPTTLAAGSSAISMTGPSSTCSALRCRCGSRQRRPSPPPRQPFQRCIDDLLAALAELRELARGLHPVVLTERGLLAALQMLAARSPVPVALDAELEGRLRPRSRGRAVLRRRRGTDERHQVRRGERRRGHAARRRPVGGDRHPRRRRGRRAHRGRQRPARPLRSSRGARRSPHAHERTRHRHNRPAPAYQPRQRARGDVPIGLAGERAKRPVPHERQAARPQPTCPYKPIPAAAAA